MGYFTRYFSAYFDISGLVGRATGGWLASNDAQLERIRRKRRELEEEADRLEVLLAQDGLVQANPTVEARHTVREYAVHAEDFSRRTQRAIAYAERARTAAAYQLALREIAKQLEEEEFALLMLLAIAA